MPIGYCTVDDVRRVLQEEELGGTLAESDDQLVVHAIDGVSATVEKATKRHWYAEEAIDEDDHDLVDTGPKTRDDEHDIPRHGAQVHGASEWDRHRHSRNSDALLESGPHHDRRRKGRRQPKQEIRIATGEVNALEPPVDDSVPAYTRITFDRKDVEELNGLHVVNEDGGYDDWAEEKEGGVGNTHRGEDYWVRVNNGGVAELYLDVHAMDDDIASLSNAIYVDIDFGHEGMRMEVRRGVAMLTASEIVDDEAVVQIPENARQFNVETLAERWGRLGVQKLRRDIVDESYLEDYL